MEDFVKQECVSEDSYSEKVSSHFTFVDVCGNNHSSLSFKEKNYVEIDVTKIKKEKDEDSLITNENELAKDPLNLNVRETSNYEKLMTDEIRIKSENYFSNNSYYDENNDVDNFYDVGSQNLNATNTCEVGHNIKDKLDVFVTAKSPFNVESSAAVNEEKINSLKLDNNEASKSHGCICVLCKKQFHNREDYIKHLNVHNSEKIVIKEIFECEKCGEQLSSEETLKEHSMKVHQVENVEGDKGSLLNSAGVKQYQCATCNKEFTNSSNLKRHMYLHTGEKPFKCTLCNKGFRERHSLEKHMPVHFKEKRIKCNLCDKSFFHENYLQKHLVVHTKNQQKKSKVTDNDGINSTSDTSINRPLFCLQCEIQFDKHEDYAIHVISHNPQSTKHKKKCIECGKLFHSTKNLERHMAVHQNDKISSRHREESTLVNNLKIHTDETTGTLSFICKICNKVFDRSYKLRDHLNVHDNNKSYKCNECGRKFASIPYLRKHSVIHGKERPHQCGICNSGFHRRSNLEVHMRTHFNDRPYKCTKCNDKTFTSLSGLNRHNKIHNGPYNCPICNKKFNSESLKIHMLLHTGEKSFVCHICNQRFAVSNYLKVHIRVKHTGERPYHCQKCNKSYTQSGHLRSHMKVHSDDVEVTIKNETENE